MPNHASATIIGHLGRDPETRNTTSGTLVFSAALAVNTGFGDKKRTTWWNVSAFGKTAETLERFNLTKGAAIGFTGEPSNREWTDKENNTRVSLELSANGFILVGDKVEGTEPRPTTAKAKPVAAATVDDECPF
ncbi:single-stranded DNA-binding protein [Mesorhizobium sp. ES1-1]|uniref:single-stranded DNA-binding protein n=1 Tax=Mesorhizobium sp. ES1-1 TaxID=2876629 RepID=UPI001CCFD813|nr:single-stranded DNA-binding protein [Mesorhizobium sp. ES1-1]MBZ9674533.1 single-stranded DNA-binding protein [Mesorhizobium sp. ES1-1]